MKFFARLFNKSDNPKKENAKKVERDSGYWVQSEREYPHKAEKNRWYRSTLPKVEKDAIRMRGENPLPGKHISFVDLEEHVRLFGLVKLTMWSDKDAHAAGAIKVSSTKEHEIIAYLKSKTPGADFKFKCFNYPEYPILYFIFGINISDDQSAILHSVADFSDGDLQEFVLSVVQKRFFVIHLFDDTYQHIKDFTIYLDTEDCDKLLNMFDSADSYYKKIPNDIANFSRAGDRFNEEYPEDFWP